MKDKKYFFKNNFNFKTIFQIAKRLTSRFEILKRHEKKTPFQKIPKRLEKKRFQILQNNFFRFQSSTRFLLVFQPFSVWNRKNFVFTKISFSKSNNRFQMFQNDFFRFPAVFGIKMKMKIFLFSPKILFSNSNRFQMFQHNFFRLPAVLWNSKTVRETVL